MSIRYEITLTNGNNTRSVTQLGFTPNKIIVLNNTSNPCYIRRGAPDIPGVTNKDYIVSPASATAPGNVTLPTSVREFGFFIPTSPAWTDTTAICTIILEGDGNQPANFF